MVGCFGGFCIYVNNAVQEGASNKKEIYRWQTYNALDLYEKLNICGYYFLYFHNWNNFCFDRCMLSIGRYLFYQVTVVCTPISANNDIMYAFLYLSVFLRRFSTHRTCPMYLLLTQQLTSGAFAVWLSSLWAAGLPTRWTAWKRISWLLILNSFSIMLLIFPSSFLTVFPEYLLILNSLSLYSFPKRSVFLSLF